MSSDAWIGSQQPRAVELVTRWAGINSGTQNLAGLERLAADVRAEFVSTLDPIVDVIAVPGQQVVSNDGRVIDRPLGPVMRFRKRDAGPDAVRVLLSIHLDTVFAADHPFQKVTRIDENTLTGPGVADAKGGVAVMLLALEAFERSPQSGRVAWEVLLNSDEEIGSLGSVGALTEAATRHQIGLVFEPAFADGSMVGERKGSGNFTVVVRGKAAHAGRDFHHGRNAVHAAASMVTALDELNRSGRPGLTVNVARIDGGGPVNVVPDLAVVRFNVRISPHDQPERVTADIQRAIEQTARRDGITVELHGGFTAPPRAMDVATTRLYQKLADLGATIGQTITWHASGGVSDANKMAAVGLPVIDTLGPRGGNLHSDLEFVLIDSITEKVRLVVAFLTDLAVKNATPPP